MNNFIDELAHFLLKDKSKLKDTVVVFPNKRPVSFLYRALGKQSNTAIFAPECYSIKDFTYETLNYKQTDNLELLFQLYNTYTKTNKNENIRDFEHFITSGEIMLADFNDIDNYMIEAKVLFENLTDAKAIEAWHPGKNVFTENEKNYLNYYRTLFTYYTNFRYDLKSMGLSYDGMAFRELAIQCLKNELKISPKTYIFAGFNALNNAEKIILKYYKDNSTCFFFWDADKAYVEDKNQEAGLYLRENLKLLYNQEKENVVFQDNLLNTEKNIRIIGAPLNLSQIKYTGQLITQLHNKNTDNYTDTVFVPADETLFPAILDSIPNEVESINITMGFSLSNSQVFGFFNSLLNLHLGAWETKDNFLLFSYKEVFSIIENSYFLKLIDKNVSFYQKLKRQFIDLNKNRFSTKEIVDLISEADNEVDKNLLLNFFTKKNKVAHLTEFCILLCQELSKKNSNNETMEVSMINKLMKVFEILHNYANKDLFILNFESFKILFGKLTSNIKVPFEGEPLKGLQIMGMLETRCLDFKNVIITNVNEGFLPAGSKIKSSFIPLDLRREFGLPMSYHKDAIYSYYFYRLLQRAENIFLIYNTEPDELSGKEMSRFIKQLIYEFYQKSNNKWKISNEILFVKSKNHEILNNISIENSEKIFLRLTELANNGFSASALRDYVECPFRYLLKQIIKIDPETPEIEDALAMNIYGTLLHKTFETLYSNISHNEIVNHLKLKEIKNSIKNVFDSILQKEYKDLDMKNGKNLILYKIALNMLNNQLDSDIEFSEKYELRIIKHEKSVKIKYKILNGLDVYLKGKIDRLDLLNTTPRITDYKTGKIKINPINPKTISDESFNLNMLDSQTFQMLYYLLLHYKDENSWFGYQIKKEEKPIVGLISLLKKKADFIEINYKGAIEELLSLFENNLDLLITELLDKSNNFEKTTDTKYCKFCSYITICKNTKYIDLVEG